MASFPERSILTPSRLSGLRGEPSTSLRSSRSALDLLGQAHTASATSALQPQLSVPTGPVDLHTTSSSSASSVTNVDLDAGDAGMLMATADTESELVDAEGEVKAVDGNIGQALRDSLKKTLNQQNDVTQYARRQSISLVETPGNIGSARLPRQYFVLTNAGKPVFTSRRGTPQTSHDDITSAMGVVQALISVYADDGDKLRCINAGSTRITFLLRAPLYYVCVSSWGEPESVARLHLDYLHLQILSVVTGAQLSKIFERRTNFDLRRLLDGTERFLHSLISRLELDMGMITASLNVLRFDSALRTKVAEILVPPKEMKDTLYVLMIAENKVVTLVRPKKHSVHPADLHLLLNILSSSSLSSTPDASSWLPICLPKFNPNGFLHAYVSFIDDPTSLGESPSQKADEDLASPTATIESATIPAGIVKVGLAVVTADREGFEKLRDWVGKVTKTFSSTNLLAPIYSAARTTDFLASELGIPGLRHFIYKSRTHVQIVMPGWEEPYADLDERRRLTTLYQLVHDAVHARSGQPGGPLKLQFIRTEQESLLGWITTPFELYVALSPRLPKSAAVGAANAVTRWVKEQERDLFLRDAPVF